MKNVPRLGADRLMVVGAHEELERAIASGPAYARE